MRRLRNVLTGCMLAACLVIGSGTGAKALPDGEFDPYGEYHAALGLKLETNPRIYRDAYYEDDAPDEEWWGRLLKGNADDEEKEELEGTFKDISIRGNGKYTVKLKNADFDGGKEFRKLYAATDIPNTDEVTFKNIVVKINGKQAAKMKKPVFDTTSDYRGHCVLLVLHPSNQKVKDVMEADTVPAEDTNLIEISFEVKGFSYEKGEAVSAPKETPVPDPTAEPTASPEPEEMPFSGNATESPADGQDDTSKKEQDQELPIERKIGIGAAVLIAVGGIIASLAVVNQRKH